MRYLIENSKNQVIKSFDEYAKAERFLFNLPETNDEEIVFVDSLSREVRYVLTKETRGKSTLYVVNDALGETIFSSEIYQESEDFLFNTDESENFEDIVFRDLKTKEVRYRLVNSFERRDLKYLLSAS